MDTLPFYVKLIFVLTTLLCVYLFYKASNNSKVSLVVLLLWLAVQAGIASSGFYTVTTTLPPRFMLLVLFPVLFIIVLFFSARGKTFIDSLDAKTLTLLHIVRVPVEVVLLLLSVYKTVPQLMTFEGRNFDILSGLTSPLIFYFGFVKHKINPRLIIFWNYICLGLLLNIVINAVLSVPFPFQQFAFEQPNIAVLYSPFIWLPCCVVPLVLFSHLAVIRQLINNKN